MGFDACGAGKRWRRRQSNPVARVTSGLVRNAKSEGAGKSFPCPPEAERLIHPPQQPACRADGGGATLACVMNLLLWAVIGYLLGSIPFGLILTRLAGGGDIRSIGSGNIGATNVLRTGRKEIAAATLLLDAAKGAVAVWLAGRYGGEFAPLVAAVGAFAGHVHPAWLKFKGGKGVATLLGISAAFSWWAALGFAVAWGGLAALTRISSVGGMAGGFAAAIVLGFVGLPYAGLVVGLLSLWVLWTHRENIARLQAGTEPRIGKKN